VNALEQYESKVRIKAAQYKDYPNYKIIMQNIEKWISLRCGFGYSAIVADNYCENFLNGNTDEWARNINLVIHIPSSVHD
jgi:hypothetical protein